MFASDLIQSAKQSIELWDHYIDASVLMLLSKRKPDVSACVYLKKISPALRTDMEKHHAQYPEIACTISTNVHDRFLLIDNKSLFHIGASLKDLGKKCFAFSALNSTLIPEFRDNILFAQHDEKSAFSFFEVPIIMSAPDILASAIRSCQGSLADLESSGDESDSTQQPVRPLAEFRVRSSSQKNVGRMTKCWVRSELYYSGTSKKDIAEKSLNQ